MPRRTWLFVPGADEAAHRAAARSGADVIVLELEDFTPPELRPKARAGSAKALESWRKAGAVAAVRINPLDAGGLEDLLGVLAARPDVIMMSKVDRPEQVLALEQATGAAVEAIDCPYTFSDVKGAVADAHWAKQLGYRMKSIVEPSHARAMNDVFSVGTSELARAQRVVKAFEKARQQGRDRAKVDGALIEVPIYAAAKRLIESFAHTQPQQRRKAR
jgi:citrate lyase beta subunit